MLEALAGLGERVSLRVTDEPELEVERFPAICVLADGEDTRIRYYGLPWGFEVASIVGAVLEAGGPSRAWRPRRSRCSAGLEQDVTLEVFVTPTCPHCPPAVLLAYRAALASPRVHAAAIESTEFPQLADGARGLRGARDRDRRRAPLCGRGTRAGLRRAAAGCSRLVPLGHVALSQLTGSARRRKVFGMSRPGRYALWIVGAIGLIMVGFVLAVIVFVGCGSGSGGVTTGAGPLG